MSRNLSSRLCALLAVVGCACGSEREPAPTPPPPQQPQDVALAAHVSCEGSACTAEFTYQPAAPAARVAELRLAYSDNLRFVAASPGAALEAADKDLVAQAREPGVVRLVAFSASSTANIGPGVLATLRFERSGEERARLEILTDRPLFAPALANRGLTVSDPVEF